MKQAGVMYANLRSEMGRKRLAIKDIAEAIKMNRDTLSRKLSGKSPLYLDEAIKIQRACFSDIDVLTLFEDQAI